MYQHLLLLGVLLSAWSLKWGCEKKTAPPHKQLSTLPIEVAYQSDFLKRYSAGFDNFLANLLWVDLLQKASHDPMPPTAKMTWEFAQLDAISELDPHYQHAYTFGASFLSVFRRDKEGAKHLLSKWVRRRPTLWQAHYMLGFHLFHEMGDYQNASKHILRASELERAPFWLSALGIRLLEQDALLEQAIRTSVDLYKKVEHPAARDRLIQRIRTLRFAVQKRRWESSLEKYKTTLRKEPQSLQDLVAYLPEGDRTISSDLLEAVEDKTLIAAFKETFPFVYAPHTKQIEAHPSVTQMGLDKLGIHINEGVSK